MRYVVVDVESVAEGFLASLFDPVRGILLDIGCPGRGVEYDILLNGSATENNRHNKSQRVQHTSLAEALTRTSSFPPLTLLFIPLLSSKCTFCSLLFPLNVLLQTLIILTNTP